MAHFTQQPEALLRQVERELARRGLFPDADCDDCIEDAAKAVQASQVHGVWIGTAATGFWIENFFQSLVELCGVCFWCAKHGAEAEAFKDVACQL